MTRTSSRHKSHKQHKHSSKEEKHYGTDSEEEYLNEKKTRSGSTVGSEIRVSDSSEKKKLLSKSQSGNRDSSRKRKEKMEKLDTDRWYFGNEGTSSNCDFEKESKEKVSDESKCGSGRRHGTPGDAKPHVSRKENEDSKKDSVKEINYKLEKDPHSKKVEDVCRDRPKDDDNISKQKKGTEKRSQEECPKVSGWQGHKQNHSDIVKDPHKETRIRKEISDIKVKYLEETRDVDRRHASSNGSQMKQEKQSYEKYREKERDDLGRDNKHQNDKHRDHGNTSGEACDNNHFRTESKVSESHKKVKRHCEDAGIFDYRNKYKSNGAKRKPSDENDDQCNTMPSEQGSHGDKMIQTYVQNVGTKSSPSNSTAGSKGYQSQSSRKETSIQQGLLSEERFRSTAPPVDFSSVSERVSESHPTQPTFSLSQRSPGSVSQASSIHTERSPSPTSNKHHFTNKTLVRRKIDMDGSEQKSAVSMVVREYSGRDSRDTLPVNSPRDVLKEETFLLDGSSSLSRTGSSNILPSDTRQKINNMSVFESREIDHRGQAVERKSGIHSKRNNDDTINHDNSWKTIPNWSLPVTNGFLPFQHSPNPGGFHTMIPQFPSPLYGVRPSSEPIHASPYHMQDFERYSSHGRPFGWMNPTMDPFPPSLHCWQGNNGAFGDEAHMYANGRMVWDQNRQNGQGWGLNSAIKTGKSSGANLNIVTSHKELDHDEGRSEGISIESEEVKETDDSPLKNLKTDISKDSCEKAKISFDGLYLSRLDLSLDLADPELYKLCTSLVEKGDPSVTGKIIQKKSMGAYGRKDVMDLRKLNKIPKSSHLPIASEVIFQKCIALYQKQCGDRKIKILKSSPSSKSERGRISSSSEVEKDSNTMQSTNSPNKECTPSANINTSGQDEENQFQSISSSSDSPICVVPISEPIECVSRIHNSPESTH